MKVLIPTAFVVLLQAGFLFSVAALPEPTVVMPVTVEVAACRAHPGPLAKAPPPAAAPVAPRS